ncbi:OLC1v1029938C1 [Oldenlandia corymbosa var. corymbosa]|uniref:Hexosyltransferase n=1 Tax=Oldenlandia corymbosa var. corymbosa TaxID=529605 RepID=A0AAV1CGR5_OLDCO|nr:OLC1v1029938C1 [Oldenlandia corymbosa var. corymbosa]
MSNRGSSNHRQSSVSSFRSRFSFTMLSMFACMASLYVAGRLWQDAENRVQLVQELDKRTGQGHSAVSVDETLKIIDCREQQQKLGALQMELEKARQEGFVSNSLAGNGATDGKKKLLAVVGIITTFGRKNNRDAIRKAWMPGGAASKILEEKGIIIRFVVGRSANPGDGLDKDINNENRHQNDFIILDDHVEAAEESTKKVKKFFSHAVEHWNAEFYVKVNDDIYVNIDALGSVLANHLDKPRVYLGCMKSGEVFSQPTQKWYEPEWWKFGDKKSYFRHASGEIYAISQSVAQFISINKSMLRSYAHDDVSAGSWFIGLDVKHVGERKFCCSSWSSGSSLSFSPLLTPQPPRVLVFG